MVRLRLRELIKARKISGYRLAKDAGLSEVTIYHLTADGGRFKAIRADTIDRLCAALKIEPGDLFTRK